jgi:hypothetical protein
MNIQQNQNIHGLPSGVSYGQDERVDELNTRLSNRHFADSPLKPNYDPRPVQTKMTLFPVVKHAKQMTGTASQYPDYNISANFNPGNDRGPVNGFIQNIDTETILRNQTFALQHGASQSVYVPSSSSELYNVQVVSRPSIQPHLDLFSRPSFTQQLHPNLEGANIGNDRFFNHTRTQLRNQ